MNYIEYLDSVETAEKKRIEEAQERYMDKVEDQQFKWGEEKHD